MNDAFSVSDLNRYVGEKLASDPLLSAVRVFGEISGLKLYPSGHFYFTLKDQDSQVSCVAFRKNAQSFPFLPENGISVIVTARASLYDRDGRFQLVVYQIEKEGIGDIHADFERLKRKLTSEGIFAADHKKMIPLLPKRIGVVTSPKGAVISDIIRVLSRRFPNFNLLIYPASVQGMSAASEITNGIIWFCEKKNVDVIIIARGGGSAEDLWCFNNETLARAIYHADIPVISAVGHETDYTICDFASDLRAPTPSAAAELVMPIKTQCVDHILSSRKQLSRSLLHFVTRKKNDLLALSSSRAFLHPRLRVESEWQRIDRLNIRLNDSMTHRLSWQRNQVALFAGRLDALSPLKVLSRGYAIATDQNTGKPITTVHSIYENQKIKLRLQDGEIECRTMSQSEEGPK